MLSVPGGSAESRKSRFDPDQVNMARVNNYWLGGKDNFLVDRMYGEKVMLIWPNIVTAVRANRDMLARAVRYLAGLGIDQFLDIGPGLPAPGNTHEVAQSVNPAARVVYGDNDVLVMAHARALLADGPPGSIGHIDADVRMPQQILDNETLWATLDRRRPVALILGAVMHLVPDGAHPHDVVETLKDALAPGSALVLTHGSTDFLPGLSDALGDLARGAFYSRTYDEVVKFFGGWDLVDPGLTLVSEWRPDETDSALSPEQVSAYGGVAFKP